MMKQNIHDFILEKDDDSGHKEALSIRLKKKYGIQYYLNSSKSPDLSPIE